MTEADLELLRGLDWFGDDKCCKCGGDCELAYCVKCHKTFCCNCFALLSSFNGRPHCWKCSSIWMKIKYKIFGTGHCQVVTAMLQREYPKGLPKRRSQQELEELESILITMKVVD